MKFVYVLVSNDNDFYADQCAISIYSLRKYNKNAKVHLLCDEDTHEYIKREKNLLIGLTDEILPLSLKKEYNSIERSRYLKTSARQLIEGDFLFLDTDTIVTGNLDELRTLDCEIGAVRVQDSDLWNKNNQHPHFKTYNKLRNLPDDYNHGIDFYYNSGIILCKDTNKTHDFYNIWHNLWKEGSEKYHDPHDQCSFDVVNALKGNMVADLDGKYNLAAIYPLGSIKYLSDCKIFHYFTFSKRLDFLKVKDPGFLIKLREKPDVNIMDEMIENIKNEYIKGLSFSLQKEKDPEIFLIKVAKYINDKYPGINSFAEKFYNFFKSKCHF